jgi:hypothetical protein
LTEHLAMLAPITRSLCLGFILIQAVARNPKGPFRLVVTGTRPDVETAIVTTTKVVPARQPLAHDDRLGCVISVALNE